MTSPAAPLDPELHPAPAHVPGGVLAFVPVSAAHDGGGDSDATLDALEARGALQREEVALARALAPARRASFVAGRLALRAAVGAVRPEHERFALLRDARGRPLLPPGVGGSISHKRDRAVAIAAPDAGDGERVDRDARHIGVDLEARPSPEDVGRPSLARRILTAREQDALDAEARDDALAHREGTLVRFALKEAIYKAIDPWVGRYVRFTEVELDLRGTGANAGDASVGLLLPELDDSRVRVTAAWRLEGAWIIATARSERLDR